MMLTKKRKITAANNHLLKKGLTNQSFLINGDIHVPKTAQKTWHLCGDLINSISNQAFVWPLFTWGIFNKV